LIQTSELFDFSFYKSKYYPHAKDERDAIRHYVIQGVNLHHNPNHYFDTQYYRTHYPDVVKAKFNPLLHYILYGSKENRNPSTLFNTGFYQKEYPDVEASTINPLKHFLVYGLEEGRRAVPDTSSPKRKKEIKIPVKLEKKRSLIPSDFETMVIDVIKNSGLFDEKYYATQDKGPGKTENPISHYIFEGAQAGLNPSASFNTNYYFANNADVKEAQLNPLYHFVMYGVAELRNPSAEFETDLYLEMNLDVKNAGLNPLYHYLNYGKKEGRIPNRNAIMDPNTYLGWVRAFDMIGKDDILAMKKMIPAFKLKPLISVLTPVYNPDIKYFRKAIDSVINQTYENWELCLADDKSTDPEVRLVLEEYAGKDKRIKLNFRKENGHISEATNSALEIAKGEFILLLDQDDEIPKHAMFMIVDALNKDPDLCLFYSDEDKMDVNGYRHGAYFKSDWNYDLFNGHNMVSHLGVYKTSIVRKINGFRKGYEGSQDYDLAHRFIEQIKTSQIKHIPHILYHWRTLPTSTAVSMGSKNYAFDAALRSLSDHLLRTKQQAVVTEAPNYGYRVKRNIPTPEPLVSIIIPIKDKVEFLKKCITSIFEKTTYKNFEIIIADNGSKLDSTKKYLKKITTEHKNIRKFSYPGEFNYSAINNEAVKIANGEIIGLVNNDIEVINEEWLSEIVSQVLRKDAGAVGAKLYYSNETVQHAGIVLGIHVVGNHIHKNYDRKNPGYFNKLELIQNFTALTAACLFVKKSIYLEVGGLDAVNLKVAYNDVDFCLRLHEKGYLNIWTPFAELYHHESVSRGQDDLSQGARYKKEIDYMYKKWGKLIDRDPYYNPNLSNDSVEFRLSVPPRQDYPWKEKILKVVKEKSL
jgi:glycosyltransferase involved in cell wall biosynthesis